MSAKSLPVFTTVRLAGLKSTFHFVAHFIVHFVGCIADLQSAYATNVERPAGWKSAIQQVENLRYNYMKLIVLAAGYATRLYPLTLMRPKPLLPVAGKPMMEHVLKSLGPIREIDRVYVVTNAKFADQFEKWARGYSGIPDRPAVTIVNDRSTDDKNKLGAIGDLHLVLTREKVDDDIIVVAADNLFSDTLEGFGDFIRQKNAPVLGVYDVGSLEEVKKYNAITVDFAGRITFFAEKPKAPSSTLTGIALYYYPRPVLELIRRYIAEGNNPDQPGRLIQWLYPRTAVYTWRVPGLWYDIGSREALEEANRIFAAS